MLLCQYHKFVVKTNQVLPIECENGSGITGLLKYYNDERLVNESVIARREKIRRREREAY